MYTPFRIVAFLLLFSLVPAPLFAQFTPTPTASSTAATSTRSNPGGSGGGSNGLGLAIGIGAGLFGLGLLTSLGSSGLAIPSARASLSFGGRVVAVVPCVSGFGQSLFVVIRPAGVFAPAYIWTPLTITKLVGPPRTIGQQVLGRADIPFVCFIPAKPPIPLYGLRMQVVGTSLF